MPSDPSLREVIERTSASVRSGPAALRRAAEVAEADARPATPQPCLDRSGVHATHCCPVHGCKYSMDYCPVALHARAPVYPANNGCERCEDAVAQLERIREEVAKLENRVRQQNIDLRKNAEEAIAKGLPGWKGHKIALLQIDLASALDALRRVAAAPHGDACSEIAVAELEAQEARTVQ